MKKYALKYHNLGLSIIPIGDKKIPIGSWRPSIEARQAPDERFDRAKGVGLVCGKVSGGLEVIDIDVKHDPKGDIFEKYVGLLDDKIADKLVLQKTVNGGYHLMYKCSEIAGNKKLAKNQETGEAVIETRGEGGYVAIAPTPGYSFKRFHLNQIPEITPDERNHLISAAMSFNQVEDKVYYPDNCFEDYNDRGNVLGLLQNHGWSIQRDDGDKVFLKRPGESDSMWSADYTRSKNWFTVFSTSTEFESLKAYKPANVYAILECGSDFKETAKKLKGEGYGSNGQYIEKPERKTEIPQNFVATEKELSGYVEKVLAGDLEMGKTTTFSELDTYFLFKDNNFVIFNGHDNVGKSVFIWYMAVVSAKKHGWRWIIYAAENRVGFVYTKLLEFYSGQFIKECDLKEAKSFIDKHFTILNNLEIYSYSHLLKMGEKLCSESHYDCFFIDPYNSLDVDLGEHTKSSTHDYHYKATSELRLFSKKYCGIWLSCHAVTFALRQKDPDGNPAAPMKADTEGGGKFSNRADDFVTLHRKVQDKDKYRIMEVHVRKIKETESGGRPTPMDSPVLFEMWGNNAGYSIHDPNLIKVDEDEKDAPF